MEEIIKLRDYKHKVLGWKEELEEKEEKKQAWKQYQDFI